MKLPRQTCLIAFINLKIHHNFKDKYFHSMCIFSTFITDILMITKSINKHDAITISLPSQSLTCQSQKLKVSIFGRTHSWNHDHHLKTSLNNILSSQKKISLLFCKNVEKYFSLNIFPFLGKYVTF